MTDLPKTKLIKLIAPHYADEIWQEFVRVCPVVEVRDLPKNKALFLLPREHRILNAIADDYGAEPWSQYLSDAVIGELTPMDIVRYRAKHESKV